MDVTSIDMTAHLKRLFYLSFGSMMGQDVLVPFAILMGVNLIVLTCWTILAPLTYQRRPASGTDYWNRVYRSYYGTCTSATATTAAGDASPGGEAIPYVVILLIVNSTAVILANIQYYQARNIHSEFSESRYVAMATASILQAIIVGTPILVLVHESPKATYTVFSLLIFIACTAILLLLFLPKILYMREYDIASAHRRKKRESADKREEPTDLFDNEVPAPLTASTTDDLKFVIVPEVSGTFNPDFPSVTAPAVLREVEG